MFKRHKLCNILIKQASVNNPMRHARADDGPLKKFSVGYTSWKNKYNTLRNWPQGIARIW